MIVSNQSKVETLSIRTLGGLAIELEREARIATSSLPKNQTRLHFRTRTIEALLIYVACQRRPINRDLLAEMLWPERTQEQARANLRVAIHRLREQLDPYVVVTRQNLALNPQALVTLDAVQFEARLAGGDLPAATALYRGDFLEGFYLGDSPEFEHWVLTERERLRRMALHGLQTLLRSEREAGKHVDAINTCRRILDLESWHEEAHRQLMWLLDATGQRNAALAQYESCCRVLEQELGVPPAAETTALYEQIKQHHTAGMPHQTQPRTGTHQPVEGSADKLSSFTTFGKLLHYLRRRETLTQRELAIAVGYSESMISRLEHDERPPDTATIIALFAPALHVADQPDVVAQLIRLASKSKLKETDKNTNGVQVTEPQSRQSALARHRLPLRLTSFLGRENDILAVTKLLARSRLLTLTGPGGSGKTSLAVETCRRLAETDGQLLLERDTIWAASCDAMAFVELYPLSDPSIMAQGVLAALEQEGNQEQPPLQLLLNTINERRVLLILDNCEHLVDDVARFVRTLLQRCKNLRVLATSRERLNIAPESVYAVAPLPGPQERPLPDFANIATSPAVQLFVERSQAVTPAMQLTPQNAVVIAQICTLLDGVPLALELGAAATATFSLQEIVEHLVTGKLLTSPGYRDAEPRHRSINDTVAWSYNLLAPAEQQLLAELAVFAGGWTLEAMEQVVTETRSCTAVLRQLVQKSLVHVEHGDAEASATRYYLLRAVREYAAERLATYGNEDSVRRRHFTFYIHLGVTLGDRVLGAQHAAAMAGLDADYPNLRAALAFAAGKGDLAEQRAQLAAALPFYWRRRGYVGEGLGWLRPIMDEEGLLSLPTRALVYAAALLLRFDAPTREYQYLYVDKDGLWLLARADALIEPCLEQGDEGAAALLMITVASLEHYPGSEVKAAAYARRSWEIFEHSGDMRGAAMACNLLTRILIDQGDVEAAQRVHSGAVHSFEQHGMTWALCEAYRLDANIAELKNDRAAMIRNQIRLAAVSEQEQFAPFMHDAFCELEREEPATAIRMAEALLERQRKLGPSAILGLALHQLGRMRINTGRYQEAGRFLDEALELWARLGELPGMGMGTRWSLLDRGQVARFTGDKALAIACFSESIRLLATDPFLTYPLLARGQTRFESADLVGAMEDYRACSRQAAGDPDGWRHFIVYCLAGIGEVAYLRGDISSAAKLWAACAAFYEKWEKVETLGVPYQALQFHRVMAAAVKYRQDPIFDIAWHVGEALPLEQAVELALAC